MKTTKKLVFLLLSALLVFGLLLTSCPEPETVDTSGSSTTRQVEIKLSPSGSRFTLTEWTAATDAQKTLTVTLTQSKSASYKWYSRTDSKSAGTEIAGATAASYIPSISADGTYYYYVVVTVEEKDLTTGTAVIEIASTPAAAPTQFKIGSDRLNYVRGVGGTGSFMFRAGSGDASPDADVKYVDLLMGTLGANIFRIMVQDDYENYITNTIQSKNSNVFYHDAKKNFFPVIKRVNQYGGYVFANPWTAPIDLKANGELTGGELRSGGAAAVGYANHLRNFLIWLNENKAPIFAIGILNEPDYGGSAGYEGMGLTGQQSRDWFKTVGHFTTQKVKNPSAAGTTTSIFDDNAIIPGYGGGGPTHHVLVMSGDSMGDIATYMNPQLNDAVSNSNIELMGRHYYASVARYTRVVGNPPHHATPTAWLNRPQGFGPSNTANYEGPHEAISLAMSPQMYAPGSTVGNIKREVWQTEHDFNFGSSTIPPGNNAQTFWNCVFIALHDIDWALRVNGESVYDWWYSSSFSGFVTSWSPAGFPPHTITPRGKAFAHYARYVNETWFLPIKKTAGNIEFNVTGSDSSPTFNAGSTDPKISAYEDVNGKFITVVMYTPSNAGGAIGPGIGGGTQKQSDDPTDGSTNVGRIAIELPDGFTATEATAIRSYGHDEAADESWDTVPAGSPRYWIDEPVFLSKSGDNSVVEVTLPGGNIISIMIKGTWPGRQTASPERKRPYTVK